MRRLLDALRLLGVAGCVTMAATVWEVYAHPCPDSTASKSQTEIAADIVRRACIARQQGQEFQLVDGCLYPAGLVQRP